MTTIEIKARRRISALLNKTVANGATEEEAKSAKALAAEISDKYLKNSSKKQSYPEVINAEEIWNAGWDGSVKNYTVTFGDFELAARIFDYLPSTAKLINGRAWVNGSLSICVTNEFGWAHIKKNGNTLIEIATGNGIDTLKTHLWNFHDGDN
jgi:hypothetical protein